MEETAYDSGDDFVAPEKKSRPEEPRQLPVSSKSMAVPQSRFANSRAKKSLASQFSTEQELLATMVRAEEKLLRTKKLMYMPGLTADLVEQHPLLARFVCWTSSIVAGCGVSECTPGKSNSAGIYYKVSVGKDVKFQAHKLMLCQKLGVVYRAFNGQDLDTSHLCHNRHCWRPSHLVAESHRDNFSRNDCPGWLVDSGSKRMVRMCKHETPCEFARVLDAGEWMPL